MEDGILHHSHSNPHGRALVAFLPDRLLGSDCSHLSRKALLFSINSNDCEGSAFFPPDGHQGDQRTGAIWLFGSRAITGRGEQILSQGSSLKAHHQFPGKQIHNLLPHCLHRGIQRLLTSLNPLVVCPLNHPRSIAGDRRDLRDRDSVREQLHDERVPEPMGSYMDVRHF